MLVSGFLSEFCVLSTYRGALERGYDAALLRDGITSLSDEHTRLVKDICKQLAPAELDEIATEIPVEKQSSGVSPFFRL